MSRRARIEPPPTDEEIAARNAQRLADLKHERGDYRWLAFLGLMMLLVGIGAFWFVGTSLRQGYVDVDDTDRIVHAADEPWEFYIDLAIVGGLGLFGAVLGGKMVLHAVREAYRIAHLSRRLSRTEREP
jgi:hypothetical protein